MFSELVAGHFLWPIRYGLRRATNLPFQFKLEDT